MADDVKYSKPIPTGMSNIDYLFIIVLGAGAVGLLLGGLAMVLLLLILI